MERNGVLTKGKADYRAHLIGLLAVLALGSTAFTGWSVGHLKQRLEEQQEQIEELNARVTDVDIDAQVINHVKEISDLNVKFIQDWSDAVGKQQKVHSEAINKINDHIIFIYKHLN